MTPSYTAAEIAAQLKGEVIGDGAVRLTGFAAADRARAGDLTFAEKETYFAAAEASAAAAILVTPTYLAKFDMGAALGTKAFFAAIIGGFNNSRGALLGGVIVGVCENLAAAYISPAYKDAVALIIFMVVILFKPQGLLGKKVERKV